MEHAARIVPKLVKGNFGEDGMSVFVSDNGGIFCRVNDAITKMETAIVIAVKGVITYEVMGVNGNGTVVDLEAQCLGNVGRYPGSSRA